ncbi:P-loop ATPase, Sll1717 family [Flavobacterium sp. GSP11]|uniref:P-loop ATPase, Sll1717 family n=1 Tax=Flavobacterium sp. GSP11 TaxID=3401730 RepID=UPI003AAB0C03
MTLDQNLGLKKNPFSKRSSEQELDFLDYIFYEPNYYKTLINDLSNGDSRFIIGQRGHGKSSIINKLLEDLESNKYFTIKIDRFDSIPIKRNETAFIKLILKILVTKISIYLDKNKDLIKKLDQVEKEKLALFIRLFFRTLSKSEYTNIYNNLDKVKVKNFIIRIFNKWCLTTVNTVTSTAVSVTSNMIRQSLGFDSIETENVYKEYFGTINEIKFENLDIDKEDCSKEGLKHILDEVLDILQKLGFETTIILFDKIDEYQDLNQDISKIVMFTSEILSDTELLLNEKLAIGFSLWSELKSELAGIVRFDKFGSIDVRWKSNDLEPLIDKRIAHFSINRKITLKKLIPHENDRKELIHVAHKSPRDLISLLSDIYQEQSNNNQIVDCFERPSISKGLINFCSNYDYDSIYPSKSGRNKDIKAMINRILAVRLARFTIKQLTDTFNQNPAQSEGQIKLMINYRLIREDDILGPNNVKYFEVIDPKVEFLLKKSVTKIE